MLDFEVRLRELVKQATKRNLFYLAVPVSQGNWDPAQQSTVRLWGLGGWGGAGR